MTSVDHDAPVFRLADDVLVQIFDLVGPWSYYNVHGISFDHADYPRYPLALPPKECIAFSQVCRRWRSVSLATASLWTLPLFHCPDFATTMIDRSQIAPLTIMWPDINLIFYSVKDHIRALQSLLSALDSGCLSRVREVALCGTRSTIIDILRSAKDLTPNLEIIRLFGAEDDDTDDDTDDGADHDTDDGADHDTDHDTPNEQHDMACHLDVHRLTHLELVQCPMPIYIPGCATLTHISVDCRYMDVKVEVEQSLASIFARASMLQCLVLKGAAASILSPDRTLHLAQLRYLQIEDQAVDLLKTLRTVTFPLETRVKLVISDQDIDNEDAILFFQKLADHIDIQGATAWQKIVMTENRNERGYYGSVCFCRHHYDGTELNDGSLEANVMERSFVFLFKVVTRGFPLDCIRELHIELDSQRSPRYIMDSVTVPTTADCLRGLTCMPNLKILHLSYPATTKLICLALAEKSSHIACPALETLKLSRLSLIADVDQPSPNERQNELLALLKQALAYRHSLGSPVQTLILDDVDIGAEGIDAWKQHVHTWVSTIEVRKAC
jgi:hypothetical protein